VRSLSRFGLPLLTFILPFPSVAQEAGPPPPRFTKSVSFNGLFYLTYEEADEGGERACQFFIRRAYLTTNLRILPELSGRITFDTSQDMEGDGRGDMEVRLKYAYAKYDFGDWGSLRGLALEGGIVHMVWLDFEEHINLYRMRDPMFLERSGVFNSADFGLTFGGGFGPDLPEEYRESVNSSYPAKHGSFAIGVYNGTGYHGDERNKNKVLQGRLTVRPFPETLPGLQLSGLGIVGKGNQSGAEAGIPDWRTFDLFLSYQDRWGTLTGQYMWGDGNQKGTWTLPSDPGEATDYNGYSLFGEGKPGGGWRIIGGFDRVERMSGPEDRGFYRIHAGAGYDFGSQNVLLLDFDRREWKKSDLPTETRVRVVFQLKF
jgi:hypothetical protein